MPATNATNSGLPAGVRRERMLAHIRQHDFVRVAELADRFGVSEVTVRTDLDALSSRGHLRRVRGGAIRRSVPGPERPFEESAISHAAAKRTIAIAAAAMVASGTTVILDVGTTTTAIAQRLAERVELRDVTVFTNSLTIALALEVASPRITVVVTGGTLRPLQHSLVDPLGSMILDNISAAKVFLGCNGVDADGGVTNINLPEAEIKRRMLRAARERVVVADGSKLGEVTLAQLCRIDEIDLLITDESAESTAVEALREQGLVVLVATEPGEADR
ncbi:MAG: DeoR family transcriptional regulator of aga operon [Glaciecola sp.]